MKGNTLGAIRSILLSDSSVTALVGQNIFPVVIPETKQPPYVRLSTASVNATPTKSGTSVVDEARIQIDVWATSQDTAVQIDEKIRAALDGYAGTVTVNSVAYLIDGIRFESWGDDYEEDWRLFRRTSDYMVRLK